MSPARTSKGFPMPSRLLLESLEARIAPAVINGGPTSVGGQEYNSAGTSFKAASDAPVEAGDPAVFTPADTQHFFLDLKAGDTLRLYSASGYSDFINVTSGRAYAFFFDSNNNGIPEANELTGLVLSSKASVNVKGDVDGSILATLDAVTGTFSTNGVTNNGVVMTVGALNVSGNVGQFDAGTNSLSFGHIVAGGSLTNITAGRINTLQSGTPAVYDPMNPGVIFAPLAYDLGGKGSGAAGDGVLGIYTPGAGIAGGSITNVSLNAADNILAGPGGIAGVGGKGGVGGSITNVKILGDGNGLVIGGGAGGSGGSLGGAGGGVTQVVIAGVAGSSSNLINIFSGVGGDSLSGKAGLGGKVDKVWIGYEYDSTGKTIVASENTLLNQIMVRSGDGGSGLTAGAGGALTALNIIAAPQETGPAHEIQLLGGHGGTLLANSTAAAIGGSISNFKIQNLDPDGGGVSDVLVRAGNASDATALLPGLKLKVAAGGSITNPVAKAGETWLVGQSFEFQAGNGYGSPALGTGGAGGSVSNLYFSSYADQFLESLSVKAGAGGDFALGVGGAGGSITGLFVPISQLSALTLTAGAGGKGQSGNGGAGGAVRQVQVFDFQTAVLAPISIAAGSGGESTTKAGGAGGAVANVSYFGRSASLAVTAGSGGKGISAGGVGGSISALAFSSKAVLPGATANVTAGSGGEATGAGKAGLGGSISNANIQTTNDVTIAAGSGGTTGAGGALGAGGSLGGSSSTTGIFALSTAGSVTFTAGMAGTPGIGTPKAGAAGGFIAGVVGSAATNIQFAAGNGSGAGKGGDISRIGFYGSGGVSTAFAGNLSVTAGNGGSPFAVKMAGGLGGSILSAVGSTSSDATKTVLFTAGAGGGGSSTAKAGTGGGINGLTITQGNAALSILAGKGGDGVAGAVGGSILNVAVLPSVVVRAVAAGDGGNALSATGKGGAGGSIQKLDVAGDLGIRSGQDYGFATDGTKMGGVFAGQGGINTSAPLNSALTGLNGNVTSVTAQAISAIVAGRGSSPLLVGTVDKVYLAGNTSATVNGGGGYTNFSTANLVGGKASAVTGAAGASDFHYVGGSFTKSDTSSNAWNYGVQQPLDGLIAASNLTSNRNFMPLAFLTNTAAPATPPNYQLFVPTLPLA